MGKAFENAMNSILHHSGYSDKATNEIMKWYKPKKTKATKNWRNRAWMIDFKKTMVIFIDPEPAEKGDHLHFVPNPQISALEPRSLQPSYTRH